MIFQLEVATTPPMILDLTRLLSEFNVGVPEAEGAEDVISVAELVIPGRPSIKATTERLEEVLRYARHNEETRAGPRVFIYWQPYDRSDFHRCELFGGQMAYDVPGSEYWIGSRVVSATLTLRHEYGWEEVSDIELALSNDNGSDVTGGITIENTQDATHTNFVAINGEDVLGDLPARVRIEFTNTYNDAQRTGNVWVGLNVHATPNSLTHYLEAEDATGGTPVVGATFSNGETVGIVAQAAELTMLTWALSSNFLAYCNSDQFHLIGRISNDSSNAIDCRWRWRLLYGNTTIWQTDQFYLEGPGTPMMRDMGIVRLPPWRLDGASDSFNFALLSQSIDGTNKDVQIDVVWLLPIDGFMKADPVGYNLPLNSRLIIDGINDQLYSDIGAGTSRRGNWIRTGIFPQLWPSRDQRLYFVAENDSGGGEIARTASIKVFYRPRRAAL